MTMSYLFKTKRVVVTETEHLDNGYALETTDISHLFPPHDEWKSFKIAVYKKDGEPPIHYYVIDNEMYILDAKLTFQVVGQN